MKVQRPGVLETVSLDLYMVREVGMFARNFPALVEKLDTGKFTHRVGGSRFAFSIEHGTLSPNSCFFGLDLCSCSIG